MWIGMKMTKEGTGCSSQRKVVVLETPKLVAVIHRPDPSRKCSCAVKNYRTTKKNYITSSLFVVVRSCAYK